MKSKLGVETVSKPLQPETELYINRARQRSSPTGQSMEKLSQIKQDEIDDTYKTIDLLRAKRALAEAQAGQGVSPNTIVSKLFEGRTAEQINEMMKQMSPEAMNNLIKLANSLDNSPVSAALRQQPSQSGNEMLLQYLLKKVDQPAPQQGMTTADVVAIVKLITETSRPAPQVVQASGGGINSTEILKLILEFNRPLYDQLKSKDKEVMDARIREIEAKMPGDLADQIKYVKEMAPILGVGGGTSEIDIKLEEMRESRDLDNKRLEWEQEKYKLENEADLHKWEQIGRILQGPVGDVIKNVGNAGADRVRGKGGNAKGGQKMPKPTQTQCPNCQHVIFVDADAESAVCGSCGAILQRQASSQPQPVQPTPQPTPQPQAAPAPETAPESEESEQEEEQGEENEGGPEQTENKQPEN